ncbi:hypothetical protein N0B31_05065 [Salinirubellus salinus]|jgi:hypothetical protein|uniref:Uncharacterized protein n=1 Tax=Salinirubellus salinus TaxID=1364945 RepID=A0A9E7R4E6_9EURY|nr:hypothetical protein [Salinirubellus salinus]UWM55655.1 hypothetical protein N0B31_05065 [Salinirubellus salinus]
MNGPLVVGLSLTVLSSAGYAVGVLAPYPGRAFSLTGLMVGLALLSVGGGRELMARDSGRLSR